MAYSLPDMIWFISISRGLDCFRPAYSFFFFLFLVTITSDLPLFFFLTRLRQTYLFLPVLITSDQSLPSRLDYVTQTPSFLSRLRLKCLFPPDSITPDLSLPPVLIMSDESLLSYFD